MRIAHVTDFYLPRLGGIEMHVHDLALRQAAAGHEVEIITSSPRPRGERGPAEIVDGVRVRRLTEGLRFPAALHPAGWRKARALIRSGRYDVVHAHAGVFSPLAFLAASYSGASRVPCVLTMHSLMSWYEFFFRIADRLRHWSAWPVVWTAVSDVATQPLRRLVGPAPPVLVLPNGIDADAWQVEVAPRDPNDVCIVAVMRLTPRKRAIHLLRMLARLREIVPPEIRLTAVIVGEGGERRQMERHIRRHGLGGWVSLPGRWSRDRIRVLFGRADIFVAPATLESFGIAALEARCAGVPVVARAQGGIAEYITDGLDGALAVDDDAMVAALAQLVQNPAARRAIAAHNRTVPPAVTWTDVLSRTEDAYVLATQLVHPAQRDRTRSVIARSA